MHILHGAEEALGSTPAGSGLPLAPSSDRMSWPSAVLCTFGLAASMWAGIGFLVAALLR